jgi:osmotically-inducible protein OsmY
MSRRKQRIDGSETRRRPHLTPTDSQLTGQTDALVAEQAKALEHTPGEVQVESMVMVLDEQHGMERAIQQRLLSSPDAEFTSLVVRRVPGGVCLQGVMEVRGDLPDVTRLAMEVAGVQRVINRLVVHNNPLNAPRPR